MASSLLAKARWHEVTEVAQPPLNHNQQIEAVKQCASVLFLVPQLIELLVDLNVPMRSLQHVSEFMSRQGAVYTANTRLPLSPPV